MADTKISALSAVTSLADADELVLARSGANNKITGANLKAAMGMYLLSSTTLGSAGTFDVSSISQAYNDLVLIVIARSSDTGASGIDSLAMRFNNDSGANYFRSRLRGQGTVVDQAESTSGSTAMDMNAMPNSNASVVANSFGVFEIVIFGYTSTTWHKALTFQSMERSLSSGAPQTTNTSGGGVWISTAAITRVQLMNGTTFGNLVTGSQLRIYGRL